jgi:NADH dehydrogenase [ubiquinone] 1 alpha subcomplex assembly factor 5
MPSPVKLTRVAPTRLQDAPLYSRWIKQLQRTTAMKHSLDSQEHLHSRIAQHMIERRKFVKRKTPVILDVGSHSGWFLRHMLQQNAASASSSSSSAAGGATDPDKTGPLATHQWGVRQYIQVDVSEEALDQCYNDVKHLLPPEIELVQICADEEQTPRPFELPDRSVDMVVSCMSMHWINQLENAMINIRSVLRRDGCLFLSMLGGNTLFELRSAFSLADMECRGGMRPHVSPQIDGAGISSLVLQTGFNLPSIDMERFVVSYRSPFELMEHLQAMGEQACHLTASGGGSVATSNRTTLGAMAAVYETLYGKNGRVPATYEVFHAVAWSPSPSQPQPLPRGSGEVSLSSIQTNTYKEFNKAMAESARNPNDKELQQRADKLYQELKVDMEKQMAQRSGGAADGSSGGGAAGGEHDWLLGENQRDAKDQKEGGSAVDRGRAQFKKGSMVTDMQDRVTKPLYVQPLPPGENAAPEAKAAGKKAAPVSEEDEERWQQFEAFMAASGVQPETGHYQPSPGTGDEPGRK